MRQPHKPSSNSFRMFGLKQHIGYVFNLNSWFLGTLFGHHKRFQLAKVAKDQPIPETWHCWNRSVQVTLELNMMKPHVASTEKTNFVHCHVCYRYLIGLSAILFDCPWWEEVVIQIQIQIQDIQFLMRLAQDLNMQWCTPLPCPPLSCASWTKQSVCTPSRWSWSDPCSDRIFFSQWPGNLPLYPCSLCLGGRCQTLGKTPPEMDRNCFSWRQLHIWCGVHTSPHAESCSQKHDLSQRVQPGLPEISQVGRWYPQQLHARRWLEGEEQQ